MKMVIMRILLISAYALRKGIWHAVQMAFKTYFLYAKIHMEGG